MKYYFYIMQKKKTNIRRITSFHNAYGEPDLRLKDWKIVSDCLGSYTLDTRVDYLRQKEILEVIYLKD